ncbi:hypothetical protein, partial [Bacteroides acidifaciens]|uniref:hypothetical protein n=1 Tax=Bacteroides acidifaciens TaxID=85831 RepID=UPI0026F0B6BE
KNRDKKEYVILSFSCQGLGTDQRTVKHLKKFYTFAMPCLVIVIMIRDRLPNIHINIFKDITTQKNY